MFDGQNVRCEDMKHLYDRYIRVSVLGLSFAGGIVSYSFGATQNAQELPN